MEAGKEKRRVILFLAVLAAAGLIHAAERYILQVLKSYEEGSPAPTLAPYFNTLCFSLSLSIFVFLLFYWMSALKRRLLPTRERSYLLTTALLMIFYIALRSAKYRFAESNDPLIHILWYLYYIPLVFIPTLFLMTCLSMQNRSSIRKIDERLLLIPASVMTAAVLTNDLTGFVFLFPREGFVFGEPGTYVRNFGYYVIVSFMVLEFTVGMILLTRINSSSRSAKKVIAPYMFIMLMGVLLVLERIAGKYLLPRPFHPPEIVAFCMLGILESCVRSRLIARNENYTGFYRSMRIPAIITDNRYAQVYKTAASLNASQEQLAASLEAPVYLDPDTRLYGSRLSAGYAFYSEDESELRRLNEQLAEANELLASENELIRAENELKERLAHVESRGRIYSRVSEALLGKRTQLAGLLDLCVEDNADARALLSRAALMTAYLKRAGALLLAEETDAPGERPLPLKTLKSAFEESALYLPYCGIKPVVSGFEGGTISSSKAFSLYTAFEDILEAIIGDATLLTVSVSGEAMRISADCRTAPAVRTKGVRAESLMLDGVCFITVRCEEGGMA